MLIIADATNLTSWKHVERWHREAKEHVDANAVFCCAINKIDLSEKLQVNLDDVQDQRKQGMMLDDIFCVSARTAYNVEYMMNQVVKLVWERYSDSLPKSVATALDIAKQTEVPAPAKSSSGVRIFTSITN